MNKIAALLLLVIISACTNTGAIGQQIVVDGITYVLKQDGKAGVTKGNYSGKITVPEAINVGNATYTVNEVGYEAFARSKELVSVTLPPTITAIRGRAFEGCGLLQQVNIPASVTVMEQAVFFKCKSLKTVSIPEKVAEIGDYAFSLCESLTGITVEAGNPYFTAVNGVLYNKGVTLLIKCPETAVSYRFPATVTAFKQEAFANCASLQEILLPKRITKIPMNAFNGCAAVMSFAIHANIESIGLFAFADCASLQDITVANSNRHYASESGVLYDKNKTTLIACPKAKTAVTIPGTVTKIESRAFNGCNITHIVLPETVTSIGNGAFRDCPRLEVVKIQSARQPFLGEGAFGGLPETFVIQVPVAALQDYTQSKRLEWREQHYKGY